MFGPESRRFSAVLILAYAVMLSSCDVGRAPELSLRSFAPADTTVISDATRSRICGLSASGVLLRGNERFGPAPSSAFAGRLLSGGGAAIADAVSQQLRLFDENGSPTFSSGPSGNGPGELRTPWAVSEDSAGRLWVLDFAPWRLVQREADGTARSETPLVPTRTFPPHQFALLSNGTTIFASEQMGPRGDGVSYSRFLVITRYRPTGELRDTLAVVPTGRGLRVRSKSLRSLSPLFEAQAIVSGAGQVLVVANSARPEFVILRTDDSLAGDGGRLVSWPDEVMPVQRRHVASERERLRASAEDVPAGLREEILAPLLDESRPIADYLPFFDDVLVGGAGDVAVRQPTQRNDGGSRFLLFDSTTAFVCALPLPAGVRALDWRGSSMLLETVLEDGDRKLEIFRIEPTNWTAGRP